MHKCFTCTMDTFEALHGYCPSLENYVWLQMSAKVRPSMSMMSTATGGLKKLQEDTCVDPIPDNPGFNVQSVVGMRSIDIQEFLDTSSPGQRHGFPCSPLSSPQTLAETPCM